MKAGIVPRVEADLVDGRAVGRGRPSAPLAHRGLVDDEQRLVLLVVVDALVVETAEGCERPGGVGRRRVGRDMLGVEGGEAGGRLVRVEVHFEQVVRRVLRDDLRGAR